MSETLTSSGNPKGTISVPQLKAIYALAHKFGHTKEMLDARCQERFGTRLSGLSKENARIIIDNYLRCEEEKYVNAPSRT
jgi:hypothetical protein